MVLLSYLFTLEKVTKYFVCSWRQNRPHRSGRRQRHILDPNAVTLLQLVNVP